MSGNHTKITCAFCKGKGKDPFGVLSKLSNCQVCLGRGRMSLQKPVEKCFACKGTGLFAHHRLPCSVCRGVGFVTKIRGEKRCEKCSGDGVEVESGLPCSSCYNLGAINPK